MPLLLCCALLPFFGKPGDAPSTKSLRVPRGSAVLIDGKVSPSERDDALQLTTSDGVELRFKTHDRYLLVMVQHPAGTNGFDDLFLSTPNGIFDLHASAKLGERKLAANGTWPEWTWWNNQGWAANVSRTDSFEGPRLLPESIREFQIDRSRLGGNTVRLRVLTTILDSKGEPREIAYPPGTSDLKPDGWLTLELPPLKKL